MLTFFLPVLAGNIVGGAALFAFLSYGQVKREMEDVGRSETAGRR